jgi:hypothetical protein
MTCTHSVDVNTFHLPYFFKHMFFRNKTTAEWSGARPIEVTEGLSHGLNMTVSPYQSIYGHRLPDFIREPMLLLLIIVYKEV